MLDKNYMIFAFSIYTLIGLITKTDRILKNTKNIIDNLDKSMLSVNNNIDFSKNWYYFLLTTLIFPKTILIFFSIKNNIDFLKNWCCCSLTTWVFIKKLTWFSTYFFYYFFMIPHQFFIKLILCNLLNITFVKSMLPLTLLMSIVSILINNQCQRTSWEGILDIYIYIHSLIFTI